MRARWQRWFRILAILLVLAVVVGLAALLVAWSQHNRPVTLPQPTGPYSVGRAEYDWTDESRPETFTPDPNDRRELSVWIWYPVGANAAGETLPYLPGNWQAAEERVHGGLAGQFISQNLSLVQARSLGDMPLAPRQKPYPVIIFQPGLGPSHPDYTTLAEDLASRGYVVVASTPSYSANVAVFSDGRIVERVDAATVPDSASPAESKAMLDRLIDIWAADNSFIMNRVEALDAGDPDGRFTDKLDLDAIGVMGHSFGGASAAETCFLDARCKAGVDLDGWPYGKVVDAGTSRPFLFFWSEPGPAQQEAQAQALQDVRALVDHSAGPIYELTIRGARHFNFADYAVLFEPLLHPMQMLGSVDGRRGLQLTTTYVAAFLDEYLRQQPQLLLDGASADYPEVQFAVHHGG